MSDKVDDIHFGGSCPAPLRPAYKKLRAEHGYTQSQIFAEGVRTLTIKEEKRKKELEHDN